ncbi:MAG: hypothetical protein RR246_05850 [Clostridia bacterium]
MDYQVFAKELLKRYNDLKKAKVSLEEDILILESEKYSVKFLERESSSSSGNNFEDHLVDVIVSLDEARFRKRVVDRDLKMIANGLKNLDEYEKELLDCFFINNIKNALEYIEKKYFRERTSVYIDRKKAIEKFTRSVYGIVRM